MFLWIHLPHVEPQTAQDELHHYVPLPHRNFINAPAHLLPAGLSPSKPGMGRKLAVLQALDGGNFSAPPWCALGGWLHRTLCICEVFVTSAPTDGNARVRLCEFGPWQCLYRGTPSVLKLVKRLKMKGGQEGLGSGSRSCGSC